MKSLRSAALLALTCAAPATAQQLYMDTVDVGGVTRDLLVYVPASYDGSADVPLLFNFHGGNSTAMDMLAYVDMRPLAEANGFLLVYPQGLPEPGGGPIWNSLGLYDNGTDEMGFAEAMIDKFDAEFALDTGRVYACGFSNGGNLVWDLACTLSHRFAAVASVAGNMFQWTYDDCSPAQPTAVMTIHGTNDQTYNLYDGLPPFTISLSLTNDYWVQVNGAQSTPDVQSVGSSTDHFTWEAGPSCFGVEHYKVNGGGHEWFGAFGSSDFDSSQVIWEFVSQYNLGGLIDCGVPSTYCESNPNSSGLAAEISWSGSNSSAANDLVLVVTGATNNMPGLFFFGPEQAQAPLGDGVLCVGGSLVRLPVVFTDGIGSGSFPIDLTDASQGTDVIQAGETWNFQFWYRDPGGMTSTYNFSNGLSVPFLN